MRQAPYWAVSRQPGEDQESFRTRAGRLYFEAQQQETAEWWRRIGMPVELQGRRVLDIGCGHGALTLDAARRGAASVTGIDPDSDRIRFARQHLRERHPDFAATVRFLDVPLDALPPAEAYDLVLSKDTFEHVEDLGRLINDAGRRLRAGGLLVCGFSPLYYSPNGDHDRMGLPLPWLHAVLPQEWVYAAGVEAHQTLRVNPIDHPLRAAFDLLRAVPWLARYFTIGVYAVYRRRDRPAGCGSNRTTGAARPQANDGCVAAPGPPGRDAAAGRRK